MSFETWLAFCVIETVLCFTPGPAVLLVVSAALGSGIRASLGSSLGILTANVLHFAISAAGLAAALVASRELFLVLKWVGAGYLVWLGMHMLLSPGSRKADARPVIFARSFLRGFVVQGSNPKAFVFFMALLPQFIDPTAPVAGQILLLGITSVVIEFVALAAYAHGTVHVGRAVGARVAGALERVGGGLLVAAGARLAAARSE